MMSIRCVLELLASIVQHSILRRDVATTHCKSMTCAGMLQVPHLVAIADYVVCFRALHMPPPHWPEQDSFGSYYVTMYPLSSPWGDFIASVRIERRQAVWVALTVGVRVYCCRVRCRGWLMCILEIGCQHAIV